MFSIASEKGVHAGHTVHVLHIAVPVTRHCSTDRPESAIAGSERALACEHAQRQPEVVILARASRPNLRHSGALQGRAGVRQNGDETRPLSDQQATAD